MWRHLSPSSWYRNVVVWLAIGGVIVAAGVAFYTYSAYRRAASDLVIERDQQVAILSSARLRTELNKFSDLLLDLSRGPEFTQGDVRGIQKALSDAAPRLAVFDGGVIFLDTHGTVRAYQPARREILGENWSDRKYFRDVLASMDVSYSDGVMDGPGSSLAVAVAAPVRGEQAQLVGVLVGYFRLGVPVDSSLYASMVRLRIGQDGASYILDGTGRVIFATSPERIGHFATPAQLELLRTPGENSALRTFNEEGIEIVFAHAPVPGTDWTLVTEEDWDRLTRDARRYANIFMLSLAAVMIVPPLGVFVLRRQRLFPWLSPVATEDDEVLSQILHRELSVEVLPTLPGWTLRARRTGAKSGGMVFHDALILPDGRLMLCLGRIQKRGVQAAIALATARASLRSAALHGLSGGEALRTCNEVLAGGLEQPMKVSCLLVIVDPESGLVEYANVGETPPIFGHEHPPTPEKFGEHSLLGETLDIELACHRTQVLPGGCMVLITRPAALATNTSGELFAQARLPALLDPSTRSDHLAEQLLSEFEVFTGKPVSQHPPLGLIVLERRLAEEA